MKKVILILVPLLLLIGGGVFGAAKMSFLKIPGITPVKKKTIANLYGAGKMYGEGKDLQVAKKKEEAPKPKPKPKEKPAPEPKPEFVQDENIGAEAVAELWNQMPTEKLVAIVKDWEDVDVARILRLMEAEKSTKLLAELEPKRASKITKLVQYQASLVPNPELKK